ncbi:MAG: DUF6305 family protein [bacterium]
MKILKFSLVFSLALCLILSLGIKAQNVKVEEPMIVTTCGQSPGSLMAQQLAKSEGIEVVREDLLDAEYLQEKQEADEGFNTLFITIGTSGKGLGAAGIDMNDEEERINAIIEEARKQDIVIIGGQIEGKARRVDKADEKSMEMVAPQSDILIVHEEANQDNYYTDLAEEQDVPIYIIEDTKETAEVLVELFDTE